MPGLLDLVVILPTLLLPLETRGLSVTRMLHLTSLNEAQFRHTAETVSPTPTACVSECLKDSAADLCKVFGYDETTGVCMFGAIDVDADPVGTTIGVYQAFELSGTV